MNKRVLAEANEVWQEFTNDEDQGSISMEDDDDWFQRLNNTEDNVTTLFSDETSML